LSYNRPWIYRQLPDVGSDRSCLFRAGFPSGCPAGFH
jgi:hypothetical protein